MFKQRKERFLQEAGGGRGVILATVHAASNMPRFIINPSWLATWALFLYSQLTGGGTDDFVCGSSGGGREMGGVGGKMYGEKEVGEGLE